MKERFFIAFTTCVINIASGGEVHVDEGDGRNGFCWALAFGNFKGGDLLWNQVNLQFEMGRGSLIGFKSDLILHSVTKVTEGVRNSLVFIIDEILMADAVEIENKIGILHLFYYAYCVA
jgi:hypothetical protein